MARGIIGCVEDTAIPAAMVGLLYALPNTQLTRRLTKEGRLHVDADLQPDGVGDQCTAGINFDPLRPKLDILRDYLTVIETVYRADRYFGRVARVGKHLDSRGRRYKPGIKRWAKELRGFIRMAARMTADSRARGPFWSTFLGGLIRNPRSIRYIGMMCGLYVHFGPFSEFVASRIRMAIQQAEREQASAPVSLPPSAFRPAVTADPA